MLNIHHKSTIILSVFLMGFGLSLPSLQAETKRPVETQSPEIPGLGDPGNLEQVVIEDAGGLVLRGPDARLQLLASGRYSSGQVRDLTHQVRWEAQPGGIVHVDADGMVRPLTDGKVTIQAHSPEGIIGQNTVEVVQTTHEPVINFPNQIVPIFTKLACNSGGCHGKASGQNGFKLSLLGFYPTEDYDYLVKEGRGRRVFPAAPDESLLLKKAINELPHGGGERLQADSHEYRLLRRWIAQGMPYGSANDPEVVRIEVIPHERTMDREASQQVRVVAHFNNGITEDVTRMTQFEANDPELADSTETGLVSTRDLTGEVAIMARYQGHVDTFRASIPLGLEVNDLPPARNLVDEHVFAKLKTLGIPPSQGADDPTFLRRVTLDLAGRLPSTQETEAFLQDQSPDKRDRVIDRLLDSGDYADYFANKWSAILRNYRDRNEDARGTFAFHGWLRARLQENMPYDDMVRQVVAASGEVNQHPPVVWYREVDTIEEQVEDTAQLFLGLRIQCARCHHHPFERWSQKDYYSFSAFFSQVGRKEGVNGLNVRDEARIYHKRGTATAKHPKTGEVLKPTGLAGQPLSIDAGEDPRLALVDWMSDPTNPFFGPALVNRYWKHFFSRGLVDPEDDMRVTNPASNPELLHALSEHFVRSDFDLKELIRTICRSQTYQLSSVPNAYNGKDKQNFSRYYPKRLNAEVLYDALYQVSSQLPKFQGYPEGLRAVQLPDNSVNSYFLTVFGRPESQTACECERSSEANLAQSLHLLNSQEIQNLIANNQGRAASLSREGDLPLEERVDELYLAAFSRAATDEELEIALRYLEQKDTSRSAFEDLVWALINTKEFLFNH
ncbi:Bacterial Ig-like domain (Group 2) [Planctomycetales bacterium 10988]|nr:Bacterial Ig-like domain (Group 2) [Planctomycetales bacterium 10988]